MVQCVLMERILNGAASLLRSMEGEGAKCILCGRRRVGLEIISDGVGICRSCFREQTKRRVDTYYEVDGGIERLYAPFEYTGKLRNAILDMKFCKEPAYAGVLAELVCKMLPQDCCIESYDMLIPVPLHPKRYEERGYNQTELLARRISEITGVQTADDVLFRIRETKHQMSLPRAMRIMNVMGAFLADEKSVAGKRIMLIDDIYTVGATMRSCAAELLAKGAAEVNGIVIAENFREIPQQGVSIPILHG